MARIKLPPTIRQRRLGAELRRLREQAELNATQAGVLLGSSQSRVSSIESGGYAVSADRVRAMGRAYGCADQALVEALAEMTGGRTRGWWDEYRDILPPSMLDMAELEHHAQAMRVASVIHMPGVLQTRDHAHAIISAVEPPLAPHEVEHRISHRIKRQAVLHGEQPTPLTATIHEAALRMEFGGPGVARAQLEYLLTMSEREHITVLVIPFGAGAFPNSGQGIIYCCGEVTRLDTVQLDTDHGSEFLDTQPQLTWYRSTLDRLEALALKPAQSRDMIRRIAQSL
ncbi:MULTISPECIES: helix-turn-helix transcriptional regulator [Streptomyces]|uniref:Helix-turn-helix transcriptional regulator n=1 Tax=Streptomyces lonegramiae TaxID=3075524 RepID=A0ABU2XIQ2_9ACTN|nr:helix-turn-helix transcriptional regulator [Streptomyces sp. DSM 41529]MDT0545808.1 helix-turn-helix transcriptional regulator [Streptomyces sp. DSM 41529]